MRNRRQWLISCLTPTTTSPKRGHAPRPLVAPVLMMGRSLKEGNTMYYDIEVRLTQGWVAIYHDLVGYAHAQDIATHYRLCNGLNVRLVPHVVAA